jgi:hypothetical protein
VSERSGPLQAPARQLAQIGDQLRQDEAVPKFESTVERLSREILEGWTASIKSYGLVVAVDDAIHSNLDDVHKSQVLAANERLNSLFLKEGLRPVNDGWIRRETHLLRRLAIIAARPK